MSEDPAAESRKRKDRENGEDYPAPSEASPACCCGTSDDDAEDETLVRPDWRMDPKESHSDWTIEVCVGGKLYSTHHVHKLILSLKSGYFEHLFAGGGQSFSEAQTSTSRIELQTELAVTAFPVMLDFMYMLWDENNPPISHQNCTALHFLGKYFQIRALRKKARQFRNKKMTARHFALYYEHAIAFHDESTRNFLVQECVRDAGVVVSGSGSFFQKTNSLFWLKVLEQGKGKENPELSTCIEIFCDCHEGELTHDIFLQLTEASLVPMISFASTRKLMKLEKSLAPSHSASPNKKSEELTSLQERCVKAIVINWSDWRQLDGFEDDLLEIGLVVYRRVMGQSLDLAKDQFDIQKRELDGKARELASLKDKFPYAVVVECIGNLPYQGTYHILQVLHDGAPKFRMEVTNREAWEISFDQVEGCWLLLKLRTGGPQNGETYWFSSEDSIGHGTILPPKNGWKRLNAPLPARAALTLTYLYHHAFDDDTVASSVSLRFSSPSP